MVAPEGAGATACARAASGRSKKAPRTAALRASVRKLVSCRAAKVLKPTTPPRELKVNLMTLNPSTPKMQQVRREGWARGMREVCRKQQRKRSSATRPWPCDRAPESPAHDRERQRARRKRPRAEDNREGREAIAPSVGSAA